MVLDIPIVEGHTGEDRKGERGGGEGWRNPIKSIGYLVLIIIISLSRSPLPLKLANKKKPPKKKNEIKMFFFFFFFFFFATFCFICSYIIA